MEQRVQTGPAEGSLFTDPPPRRQEKELSEIDTVQHPVISKGNARDGAVGHNVRYVLTVGLAAVVVGFIAVYLFYFA